MILNTICSLGKLITNTFVSLTSGLLSLQFSHSVMSNSLWPHRLQHSRLPSPSPTLGAYSKSSIKLVNHPTISYSVLPFSSRLQSFPASGSFPMSQLFASGGQSIRASASVLKRIFRTDFLRFDWLALHAVQGTQESSPTPQFKSIRSLALSFLYSPTLTSINDHWKKP